MIPKTKLAYNIWQGNNSSTTFDFDFIIDKPTDLIAVIWDMTADTREVLEYETDYTIAEFSNVNGSSITYPIADDAEKLQENEKIILLSARDVQQGWDFYSSEKFNPQRYEDAIDYIVTIQKQFERDINRSLKVPLGLDTTPEEYLENIETKIENLEKEVTAIKSEIKIINGKIVKIDSRLTVAEGKIVAMDGRLTVVEEKTEALGNKLNALSNKQNEIEQRVIKNEKDISDLKAGGGGQSPTGGGTMYVCYAVNKAKCQEGSSLVDYVANKQAIDNGELPSTISYAVGGENPNLVVTTAKGKTITISSIPDLDVSTVAALEGGGVGVWTRCVDSDGLFKLVHHSNFVYSNANADFRTQYTLENFPNGIIVQYTGVDPFETWELDGEGNWSEFNAVPLETFEIVEKEDGSYGVSVLFFQLPNIGVNSFNFNQNATVYNIMTMYDLPIVEKNTTGALSSVLDIQLDSTFKVDCRKNLGDNYAVEDFPYGLKERFNIEIELNSNELNDVYVSATTDALTCYKEDAENGVCQYFQYIGKTENGKLYTSFEIPMYAPDMYLKFEKLGVAMDVEVDKFKLEALGYQETRIESGSVKVVEEEPPTYNSLKFKTRTVSSQNWGTARQSLSVDWGDETVEEFSDGEAVSHTYAAEGIYTVTITPKDVDYLIVGDLKDTAEYAFTHGSEYLLPMPECRTVYGGEAVPIKNVGISCGVVYPENFMINNPSVSHLRINQSDDDVVSIATTAFNNLLLETIDCNVHEGKSDYNPLTSVHSWDFSFIQNLISSNALMLKALKAPYTAIVLSSALGMMSQLEVLFTDGASAGMCDALSSLKYVGFNYLSEIPTGLFGTSMTNLERVTFEGGTYASVPLGLFTNTPALKSFQFTYNLNTDYVDLSGLNFDSCPLLGQDVILPESSTFVLVDNEYIGLQKAFSWSWIKNIPSGLFANSQHVKNVKEMFYNARVQTALPDLLFNADVTESAEGCFKSCHFISTSPIPAALFKNSPNLKNLESVFESSNITYIPTNFFEGCSLLENLKRAFAYCDDLVTVPTFLFRWSSRSVPIDFEGVFRDCKNIVLPSGLFYPSIDYQFGFACCYAATEENSSISQSLFDTSKSTRFMGDYSVDLSNCFYGAGNSGAALPDLWTYTFNEETVNRTGCYVNAIGTNSAEIPDLWKQEE